jgi:hypothetical protein
MSEQLQSIYLAYQIVERNVIRALQTQQGDSTQLCTEWMFSRRAKADHAEIRPLRYTALTIISKRNVNDLQKPRTADPITLMQGENMNRGKKCTT